MGPLVVATALWAAAPLLLPSAVGDLRRSAVRTMVAHCTIIGVIAFVLMAFHDPLMALLYWP